MADLIPDDADITEPLVAAALAQMRHAYRAPWRQASDRELVATMARVMVERVAGDGACTDEHLMAAGFNREQIERHRCAATAVASHVTGDRETVKPRGRRSAKKAKETIDALD